MGGKWAAGWQFPEGAEAEQMALFREAAARRGSGKERGADYH